MKRYIYWSELALILLAYSFTWLGMKCSQLQVLIQSKYGPAPRVTRPELPPIEQEQWSIDRYSLELVAWRGPDGDNLAAFLVSPEEAEVLSEGDKSSVPLIQNLLARRME